MFSVFDKDKDGQLNLDELVLYVAEVKKTGLIEVDEGNIVNELMKRDADTIGFEELKEWTQSPSESLKEAQKQDVQTDPFGNTNVLPERFEPDTVFNYRKKGQHPCFTTTSNDLGKAPGPMEFPTKWRGRKGEFTDGFIVCEPGTGLAINTYHDRGLRTNKTRSNVHKTLDVDF